MRTANFAISVKCITFTTEVNSVRLLPEVESLISEGWKVIGYIETG